MTHNFSNKPHISLLSHGLFFGLSFLFGLIIFASLRGLLLFYNNDLIGDTSSTVFASAFMNGLRFDSKMMVFFTLPFIFAFISPKFIQYRRFFAYWLISLLSLASLLGIIELNFYREFHQRLNSIFFQYLSEDPATVLSMLWHGFPVVKLLSAWAIFSLIIALAIHAIERKTRLFSTANKARWFSPVAGIVFITVLLCSVVIARGTLRQGSPLRWGDAFTTQSLFANHLGLNPVQSLADSARNLLSSHRDNIFKARIDSTEALALLREHYIQANETLIDADSAAIRRISRSDSELPIRNVVVILLESFAGRYVGALGGTENITPSFDALAKKGLLFTRFFANGTHTHQGMFAAMACFPNLPAFEYLMQTPEGGHQFSGLPQLLKARDYQNVYVYNGDFAWDNQQGFFSNQGMSHFVGRNDYINPVFSDPTWGVSDQDMFDRAVIELNKMTPNKPFYALLQTLSNHTPYALPTPLPVEEVTDYGPRNEHLTAMRYADWALGEFFAQAEKAPWYKDTLFVVLGDHGFGAPEQLTEMDLYRFYVPMLLIAPGLQEKYGEQTDIIGAQVDMVPTIMGLLGGETQQQCWGRDLLNLAEDDTGIAIIKPSGDDQTIAIISDGQVILKPKDLEPKRWSFDLSTRRGTAEEISEDNQQRIKLLYSYIQIATQSLLDDTAGAVTKK